MSDSVDMKVTEVGVLLGKKWKELGEDEKKVYEEKAAELKKKYMEEMEAWRQRKSENEYLFYL